MAQTAAVLIADNDDEARNLQKEALASEGLRVVTANNAEEAKKVLQDEQENVAVAVLDIRLNDNDKEADTSGLDLAENEAPGVAKVLTTAWVTPEIKRRALRLLRESKIEDFISNVDRTRTDAILKAVWKALYQHTLAQAGAASGSVTEKGSSFWLPRKYRALMAIILLLFALGAGIMAVSTADARYLMGTILFAVLTVIFVGTAIE